MVDCTFTMILSLFVWQDNRHLIRHMAYGLPPLNTTYLVFESSGRDDLVSKLSSACVLHAVGYYALPFCWDYTRMRLD